MVLFNTQSLLLIVMAKARNLSRDPKSIQQQLILSTSS